MVCISLVLWGCARKTAPTAAETAAKFSHYSDSEGKTIFMEKCGRCHKYRLPETRTADKWTKVIDKMAPKAKLNDDQKEAVLAFVQQYAKS